MSRQDRGTGAVLIVEDSDDERVELQRMLEDEGFYVCPFASARDALAALRVDPPAFTVILLDLVMPDLNGWGFRAAQLADPLLRDIPTVALTCVTLTAADHYTLHAHDYLRKPVTAEQLVGVVARYHTKLPISSW